MKLKRFLLKYEPPGIGLEIEDATGGTDVRHKALPALEGADGRAIGSLVEGLLRGEPELLSGKRHAAALTSLLSRLYQVDPSCPSEEDTKSPVLPAVTSPTVAASAADLVRGAASAGSVGGGSAPGEDTGPRWRPREGMRAVVLGLEGELALLNGQVATVCKVRLQGEKCEVLVSNPPDEARTLKVKGFDRLLPLAPSGSLVPGVRVVAHGLRQDVELNGTLGRVVNASSDGRRIEVKPVVGSQLLSMRPDNLTIVEVPADHPAEQLWPQEGSPAKLRPSSKGRSPAMPSLAKPIVSADPMADAVSSGRKEKRGAAARASQQVREAKVAPSPIGSVVELCGLTSNASYNGLRAEVLTVSPDGSTFEIRMEDGSKKKLRADNARLIDESGGTQENGRREKLSGSEEDFEVGAVVRLAGLRSAAHLNGERAVVVRDVGLHVEIRMMDGSAKRVKKANVRVVGAAADF